MKAMLIIALGVWFSKAGAQDFPCTTNNGTLTITGYNGAGGDVTIPSTIYGLPVVAIGNQAFLNSGNITSIIVPNSVTNIGNQVFQGCQKLGSVVFQNSFPVIGYLAFDTCFNLTNVNIPEGVTYIDNRAFYYCWNLTTITFPKSLTQMGNGVFDQCSALSTAYFKGNEPLFVNSNPFDGRIFPSSFTTLYYLPGTTGWGSTYQGEPTQVWIPQIQANNGDFGIQANQFGFDINWASGTTVAVDACSDLGNPVWLPIQTIAMTGQTFHFTDPQWMNYPSRFYRVRSQ